MTLYEANRVRSGLERWAMAGIRDIKIIPVTYGINPAGNNYEVEYAHFDRNGNETERVRSIWESYINECACCAVLG
jgi:hypothetical protein